MRTLNNVLPFEQVQHATQTATILASLLCFQKRQTHSWRLTGTIALHSLSTCTTTEYESLYLFDISFMMLPAAGTNKDKTNSHRLCASVLLLADYWASLRPTGCYIAKGQCQVEFKARQQEYIMERCHWIERVLKANCLWGKVNLHFTLNTARCHWLLSLRNV